jgi:hypothetical protein
MGEWRGTEWDPGSKLRIPSICSVLHYSIISLTRTVVSFSCHLYKNNDALQSGVAQENFQCHISNSLV